MQLTSSYQRDLAAHYAGISKRLDVNGQSKQPTLAELSYGGAVQAGFLGHYPLPPAPRIVTAADFCIPVVVPPSSLGHKIRRDVCAKHGVTVAEINSLIRKPRFVRARQELAYRLHRELLWSSPKVGKFIKRDHTTVLYSAQQYEKRLTEAQRAPETFEAYYGA